MTRGQRDRLRALAEAATPGPWLSGYVRGKWMEVGTVVCDYCDCGLQLLKIERKPHHSEPREVDVHWHFKSEEGNHRMVVSHNGQTVTARGDHDWDEPQQDFDFIAAANPETVLSLLDALEETEKALEQAVEIGYLRYVDGFERVGASFNGTTHFPNSGVAHDELAAHLKKRADK